MGIGLISTGLVTCVSANGASATTAGDGVGDAVGLLGDLGASAIAVSVGKVIFPGKG